MEEKVSVNLRLPNWLVKKADKVAKRHFISRTALITQAINQFLIGLDNQKKIDEFNRISVVLEQEKEPEVC